MYVYLSPLVSTFCVCGGKCIVSILCWSVWLVGGCLHVMLFPGANMPSLHNIIHGPVSSIITLFIIKADYLVWDRLVCQLL